MSYQPMSLAQSHGFKASVVEGNPLVGVLVAPSLSEVAADPSIAEAHQREGREVYHSVLRQMASMGARRVVVDVSKVEDARGKLSFLYMKPSSGEVPNIELIYVAGINDADIGAGTHSGHAAQSLRTSSGIFGSLDEAVDAATKVGQRPPH